MRRTIKLSSNRTSKIMRRGPGEDAGPSTITYSYDALNREVVKDLPGGTAAARANTLHPSPGHVLDRKRARPLDGLPRPSFFSLL